MAGSDQLPLVAPATVASIPAGGAHKGVPSRGRVRRLTGADRVVVILMVTLPMILVIGLVWVPAIITVILSFSSWNGIGGLDQIKWIGDLNYVNIFENYPPFAPAIQHNVLWLLVFFLLATPLGMYLAVLLDKEIRGSRFYQTAIFLPVVLSLALVGFIWQLQYSQDQGFINGVFGTTTDWYGDSDINIWSVLVAASWRQVGYIMLLYLAGLKGVDPSLREAAAVDGASETRTFFKIVFPVLRPINVIIVVITVIESLRAFDIVWVINKGRNGLEVISALVTSQVVGEASRVGFGSALATIMLAISVVFIVIYLFTVLREDQR